MSSIGRIVLLAFGILYSIPLYNRYLILCETCSVTFPTTVIYSRVGHPSQSSGNDAL
jgi:hypothetical protein